MVPDQDTHCRVRVAGHEASSAPRLSPPRVLSADGHGTGVFWEVIASAKFASSNIVEDIDVGIDLACSGTPSLFCPEAAGDKLLSRDGRWHRRRAVAIGARLPRNDSWFGAALVLEALRRRNRDLLVLALDLGVPHLALAHVAGADGFRRWCGDQRVQYVIATTVPGNGCAGGAWSVRPVVLDLVWPLGWSRSRTSHTRCAKIPLYARFLVKRQAE